MTVPPRDRRVDHDHGDEAARRRLWRRRRVEKTHQLRTRVALMEQIALALPLVDDADEIWDEFLAPETKRVRDALRRLTPVARELHALLAQRHQIQSLLSEHVLARETVRTILATENDQAGSWHDKVVRWRRLARTHFRPWKAADCVAELNEAMLEAHRFTTLQDTRLSGLSFMGWHERRRIDREHAAVQFSLSKTYHGFDLDFHVDAGWRVFLTTELYNECVVGNRGRADVDVLQRLTPSLAIVLFHEQFDGIDADFHSLMLLATIDHADDSGATQFIRSIIAPELVHAFAARGDVWTSSFYWKEFEILDQTKPRTATDFRVALHGTLRAGDSAYAAMWLVELLASLVRTELFVTGRCALTF